MGTRKKVGIMLMFLGGGFVTVVSMLRLKYMIQFANSHNVTWDYTPIGYWSTLEVHVGIILACLPAIRSLQRRIFRTSGSPNSHYAGPSGGYGSNSKGGSPFPSIARSKRRHVDLLAAASQASMMRSRTHSKSDKEFIELEDLELSEKAPSPEPYDHAGLTTTQIERGSIHTDDGAVLLPIQSTQALPPRVPPKVVHQNTRWNGTVPLPQVITVRKDYSVTVEVTPEQINPNSPRDSADTLTRGRRESQATLTAS